MSKNNKLKDYLTTIAQHAPSRQAHILDPRRAMTKAGLSEKHQDMIMHGDTEGLKKELGNDNICLAIIVGTYKS